MRRTLSFLVILSLLAPSPVMGMGSSAGIAGRPAPEFGTTAFNSRSLFQRGGPLTAKHISILVLSMMGAYYALAHHPAAAQDMLGAAVIPFATLYPGPVKRHSFKVDIPTKNGKFKRVDLIEEIFAGRFEESMLEHLTPGIPDSAPLLTQPAYGFQIAKRMGSFGRETFIHLLTLKNLRTPTNKSGFPSANRYSIPKAIMAWMLDLIPYEKAAGLIYLNRLTLFGYLQNNREMAEAWGLVQTKKRLYVSRQASWPIITRIRRTIPARQAMDELRKHGFSIDHHTYHLWIVHPQTFLNPEDKARLLPGPWKYQDENDGLDITDFARLVHAMKDRQEKLKRTFTIPEIAEEIRRRTADPQRPDGSGWLINEKTLRDYFTEGPLGLTRNGPRVQIPQNLAEALMKSQVKEIQTYQRFCDQVLKQPIPYSITDAKAILSQFSREAVLRRWNLSGSKENKLFKLHPTLRRKEFHILGLARAPHVVLISTQDFENLFRRVGAALEAPKEEQVALGQRLLTSNLRSGDWRREDALWVQAQIKTQTGWELPLRDVLTVLDSDEGPVKTIDLTPLLKYRHHAASRASLRALVQQQVAAIAEYQAFYKAHFSLNGLLPDFSTARALQRLWNARRVSLDLGRHSGYMNEFIASRRIPVLSPEVIGIPSQPKIVSAIALEEYPDFHPHLLNKRLANLRAQILSTPITNRVHEKQRLGKIEKMLRRFGETHLFTIMRQRSPALHAQYDELVDAVAWAAISGPTPSLQKNMLNHWKTFTNSIVQPRQRLSRAA